MISNVTTQMFIKKRKEAKDYFHSIFLFFNIYVGNVVSTFWKWMSQL